MGILDRINLLVRANVSDLAHRSDVPEKALDNTIVEMRTSLNVARRQLRKMEASEGQLVARWRRSREEALDWEDKAMEALRKGDEDLARRCLVNKQSVDRTSRQVKEELESQREYMADLGKSLDALEVKMDAATSRRRSLSSGRGSSGHTFPSSWSDEGRRQAPTGRRAFVFDEDLRRDYPEDVFGVEAPFDRFDEMSDRIDAMDAKAAASRELYEDPLRDDLEDRFTSLSRRETTERGLADIKRKLLEDLDG